MMTALTSTASSDFVATLTHAAAALLEPFGIQHFYSDGWGAYQRHLDESLLPTIGKSNTQTIERKHLTLRTRIKRLACKTICFSCVSLAA